MRSAISSAVKISAHGIQRHLRLPRQPGLSLLENNLSIGNRPALFSDELLANLKANQLRKGD